MGRYEKTNSQGGHKGFLAEQLKGQSCHLVGLGNWEKQVIGGNNYFDFGYVDFDRSIRHTQKEQYEAVSQISAEFREDQVLNYKTVGCPLTGYI